jgi:PleD family two-component response regulator
LNLEELVEAADGELYRAKRTGKNRVAALGKH